MLQSTQNLHLGILKFQTYLLSRWKLTLWQMGKWQIANILKMANRSAKWSEIWDSEVEWNIYGVQLTL